MSQSRTHVELYVTNPVYSVKISGLCRLDDADSGERRGRYETRPLHYKRSSDLSKYQLLVSWFVCKYSSALLWPSRALIIEISWGNSDFRRSRGFSFGFLCLICQVNRQKVKGNHQHIKILLHLTQDFKTTDHNFNNIWCPCKLSPIPNDFFKLGHTSYLNS